MEKEIRLSSSEFKALASETRAGIIRLLKQRNHTLTELSKKLMLAAPTIKQHLSVLENAELIQELDEGRKWKYYCLTRKGKNIFAAEAPVNVFIVLGASILALAGLFYSFVGMLSAQSMVAVQRAPAPAFIESGDQILKATGPGALGSEAASELVNGAASAAAHPFAGQEVIVLALALVAVSLTAGYFAARALR
jgi:DNA-binding transcriptional ArsR family regulator